MKVGRWQVPEVTGTGNVQLMKVESPKANDASAAVAQPGHSLAKQKPESLPVQAEPQQWPASVSEEAKSTLAVR